MQKVYTSTLAAVVTAIALSASIFAQNQTTVRLAARSWTPERGSSKCDRYNNDLGTNKVTTVTASGMENTVLQIWSPVPTLLRPRPALRASKSRAFTSQLPRDIARSNDVDKRRYRHRLKSLPRRRSLTPTIPRMRPTSTRHDQRTAINGRRASDFARLTPE